MSEFPDLNLVVGHFNWDWEGIDRSFRVANDLPTTVK